MPANKPYWWEYESIEEDRQAEADAFVQRTKAPPNPTPTADDASVDPFVRAIGASMPSLSVTPQFGQGMPDAMPAPRMGAGTMPSGIEAPSGSPPRIDLRRIGAGPRFDDPTVWDEAAPGLGRQNVLSEVANIPPAISGAANALTTPATAFAGTVLGKKELDLPGIGRAPSVGTIREESRETLEGLGVEGLPKEVGGLGLTVLAVAPGMGPMKSASPAIRKVATMFFGEAPKAAKPSLGQRVESARVAVVKATTDRAVGISKLQEDAERTIGRKLRPEETLDELIRLDPNKAAQVSLQEHIKPVLSALDEQEQQYLVTYLTFADNIDVARTMGQKVEREILSADLGPIAGQTALRRAEASLRMLQRQSLPDPTKIRHAQAKVDRARQKLDQNRLASEAKRSGEAQARRIEVEQWRKFSGNTNLDESIQGMQDLQQELGPDFQKIDHAAQQIWAFNRRQLERVKDAGIIDEATFQEWTTNYPHYMPTRILDYLEDPAKFSGGGKKFSLSDSGFRRNTLEGTTKERENPLASMYRLAFQTERNIRKNEAANAFVNLRNVSPEMQTQVKKVSSSYRKAEGEEYVYRFVNGEREIYVMPKDMAQLVNMTVDEPIKGLSTAMGIFRAGLTSRNPVFLVGNAASDMITFAVRESIRADGPQNLPKVLMELGKAYADTFAGLRSGAYAGSGTRQFLRGGGGQFGFFPSKPQQATEGLRELGFVVKDEQSARRLAKELTTLKPVETVGERIELAPRVASMRLALARGEGLQKAVINGRTVTIDFAQGGTAAKFINQFIPFFNVGVQAAVQPFRAYRENPKAFATTAISLLAGPTLAAEAWNRSDPQRAKDYADVPSYIKDRHIVIMLPVEAPVDKDGNRRPQYAMIPVRDFAPFVIATRTAAERALGDDTRSWAELIKDTVASVSPISSAESFITPGLSTVVSLAADRDLYRNRNIATQYNDERAAPLSKTIAAGARGLTGANVRPSQVDFALRDLTGGPGQLALSASTIGQESRSNAAEDIPVAGAFVRRLVRGDTGEQAQRARDAREPSEIREVLRAIGIQDIGPVGNTVDGIPLKRDEQATAQRLANQYVLEAVKETMALVPEWESLSVDIRKDIIESAVAAGRDRAKAEVLGQIGAAALYDRVTSALEAVP